jgi:hypothetical protein
MGFREEVPGDVLHVPLFPKRELVVRLQVLQWNGMRSHYHRQAVLLFDEYFISSPKSVQCCLRSNGVAEFPNGGKPGSLPNLCSGNAGVLCGFGLRHAGTVQRFSRLFDETGHRL